MPRGFCPVGQATFFSKSVEAHTDTLFFICRPVPPQSAVEGTKQWLPQKFPCHAISHLPCFSLRDPPRHVALTFIRSQQAWTGGMGAGRGAASLGTHHESSMNSSDLGLGGQGRPGRGSRVEAGGLPWAGVLALTVGAV